MRALRTLRDPRAARTSAPIEIQDFGPLPLTTGQKVARAARWGATAIVVAAAATFTAWKSGVAVHGASAAGGVPALAEPVARAARVPPSPPKSEQAGVASAAAEPPPMVFHRTPHASLAAAGKRMRKPPLNSQARNNPAGLRERTGVTVQQPDAADLAHGWLRVGGAGYFGGRVIVDGEPVGFAPLERELSIGAHSIAVVSPGSGQTLIHQTIRVGGHHTHLKPLALLR
jgi:hypothetical protein